MSATMGAAASDLQAARLVTEDLARFWRAFDDAGEAVAVEPFAQQYLAAGTPGLHAFARLRIGEAWQLAEAVRQRRGYYASLRSVTDGIGALTSRIRASFGALAGLYPEARFPDVYFLFGRMQAAGSVAEEGILIGLEFYGRVAGAPLEELLPWERNVLQSPDLIPAVVAHELVHVQQRHPSEPPERQHTLLRCAIEEGAADFLGELSSGQIINSHLHAYGAPRERELYAQFAREADGEAIDGWLYDAQRPREPGRPADLGYFVGYKIVEAYYRRAQNKRQAVQDILHIQDFPAFLDASGYRQ
ncbi:MAG TPA: DUF2268 domain-containing putative Zn-dependent protease [Chloroflexota bacterium]|nr:DUF2268 domain-containing putative Zn-dependent protease [Chloroflexota bacterium]